jgi:hypothetical protein
VNIEWEDNDAEQHWPTFACPPSAMRQEQMLKAQNRNASQRPAKSTLLLARSGKPVRVDKPQSSATLIVLWHKRIGVLATSSLQKDMPAVCADDAGFFDMDA